MIGVDAGVTPEELFKILSEASDDLEEIGIPVPSDPSEIHEPTAEDVKEAVENMATAIDEGNPLAAISFAELRGKVKVLAIRDIDFGGAVVFAVAGDKVYAWR